METERCHDPANELLPWYLNGSLKPSEAEQVRVHLGHCLICARELDELARVAGGLEARGDPGSEPRAVPRSAHGARPLRVALAATLVLAALMAGYWIRNRGHSRVPGARGREEEMLSLDLRSGPIRGGASPPTLVLSRNVRRVSLRLTVPVNTEAAYEMELRSSGGEVLSRHPRERLTLDKLGRATFQIEAALLSSGEFEAHLREVEPSGEVHEYPYPFRVVTLP
jgi:hypothetical protein